MEEKQKMGWKRFVLFMILGPTLATVGRAQPGSPAAVAAAHGEPSRDFELRGMVASVDAAGEAVQTAFTLKISGDRSRLETAGKVFVREGVFGQWWVEGGPRSTPRRTWEGLRDIYLVPFFAVSGLPAAHLVEGAGRVRYAQVLKRKTHFGFDRPDPQVELDFDPDTLLLEKARFGTTDGGQTAVTVRYADYVRVRGAAIPRRIERQVGDNPPEVFSVESVSLNAHFSDREFRIER